MMGEPRQSHSRLRGVEFAVFALAVVLMGLMASSITGVEVTNRDLVDTDGYMRYLRVAELIETGDWFDGVSERSNYPFGESQHWTRVLDVYVVALTFVLRPFFGSDALYWAAFVNAPLLLIFAGWLLWRGLRHRVPPAVSRLVLPVLLGLPLVLSYSQFGRVDHHAAIFVAFVASFVSLIDLIEEPRRAPAITLGVVLALGLWLSTEFLVPAGLVGATLVAAALMQGDRELASPGATVFGVAAAATAAAVAIERGPEWAVVEYDKVSVAHVAVLAAATLLFLFLSWLSRPQTSSSWLWFVVGTAVAGGLLVMAFPGLIEGPFTDVDDRVAELWLYHVGELRPVWAADRTWSSRALVLAPTLFGLLASAVLVRRRALKGWLSVAAGWLVVYAALSAAQVRWGFFAHVLALGLVISAVAPWYENLGNRRLSVVLRPVLVVVLIFGTYGVAAALDSTAPTEPDRYSCSLADVLPALQAHPKTTVLAEQDVGPEILYRTDHNVIATPYHRNEAGILYVHDVMSMPVSDPDAITERLRERSVGLILMCPERFDTLRPENLEGTLYESLATGASPESIRGIDLDVETDYLLFAVEN